VANFDVIVIGASAGGVASLQKVVEGLPAGLPAAVFIALHLPDEAKSVLPRILARAGELPVAHAINGASIERGRIYVAPPGFHLTIEGQYMRVTRGAREHGYRPAIDPLFRSAAATYGARTIGVILSGLLDDGTVGLRAIKLVGGIAVVQDPRDTAWPSMPQNALDHVRVDYCLPVDEIGALLRRLVHTEDVSAGTPTRRSALAKAEAKELTMPEDERDKPGQPSPYSCPECGGVLWELRDGELLRFRCRVGHAYSTETLTTEQALTVEHSLWTALRALEEQSAIRRRLADRARRRQHDTSADLLDSRVRELDEHAQRVRDLLLSGVGAPEE
jgi:two-component system chemotaxis response regulator CheB